MNDYYNKQPKPELKNSFLCDEGKSKLYTVIISLKFCSSI